MEIVESNETCSSFLDGIKLYAGPIEVHGKNANALKLLATNRDIA